VTPGTERTLAALFLTTDSVAHAELAATLLCGLDDPDPRVRWRSAFGLGCLGAPGTEAVAPLVRAALTDEDPGVRSQAARVLALGGRTAADELVARLLGGSEHDATVALLRVVGAPAVEALAAGLEADDPSDRWAAVGALEDIGGADATSALVAALSHADDEVRHCAASALGHIGAPAVDALFATLADADPRTRSEAARALGYLADTRAFMPLIVALDDREAEVRGSAAWALGGLRDPRSLVPLLVALDDADPRVREGAAAGLGRSGDSRAVTPLIAVLEDADAHVRARVVHSLAELGQKRALPFLIAALTCDESEDVRWAASDALGEIGSVAVEPLLEAMDDEDDDARGWIALALESLGIPAIERGIAESHGRERRLGPQHVREALSWTDEGRAAAM